MNCAYSKNSIYITLLLKKGTHPGDNKSRKGSCFNVELIETCFTFDTLKLSPKSVVIIKKKQILVK